MEYHAEENPQTAKAAVLRYGVRACSNGGRLMPQRQKIELQFKRESRLFRKPCFEKVALRAIEDKGLIQHRQFICDVRR